MLSSKQEYHHRKYKGDKYKNAVRDDIFQFHYPVSIQVFYICKIEKTAEGGSVHDDRENPK